MCRHGHSSLTWTTVIKLTLSMTCWLAFFLPQTSYAALNEQISAACNPEFFKEVDSGTLSLEETLAIIDIVDADNFHKMGHDASGNVSIPVEGVPIKFGASYKDFSEKREILHKQYESNYSKREYQSWLRTSMSSTYVECLEKFTQSRDTPGLYIWTTAPTETEVTVHLKWIIQPGNHAIDVTVNPSGASSVKTNGSVNFTAPEPFALHFPPFAERSFVLQHKADAQVRISAEDENGNSANLDILPKPVILAGPVVPGCKKFDGRNCIFCEFKLADQEWARMATKVYECGEMPSREKVASKVDLKYTVTDLKGAGHSCSILRYFAFPNKRVLEKETEKHSQTHKAWIDLKTDQQCSGVVDQDFSDYQVPFEAGNGRVQLAVGCALDNDDRNCRVSGTLQIFTKSGNPQ